MAGINSMLPSKVVYGLGKKYIVVESRLYWSNNVYN